MNDQPVSAAAPRTDDQRKHLEFIQGVIARQSNASSTAKGWSLTLAGAAFGFSAVNDKWYLALLGCVVLGAFSVLDAYYLHAERQFRDLYENARLGAIEDYVMSPHLATPSRQRHETYRSWSILGFYGPLLVAGAVVTAILLFAQDRDVTPRPEHHEYEGPGQIPRLEPAVPSQR